jgi:endoglucanase
MDTLSGFQAGVNLGGWISQYERIDPAHFASFIREPDIQRIAGWGMDHVRLPVDYPVLEDDALPMVYHEEGFAYIDNCLEWCRKAGLNLVLDLHHAPGFSFTTLDKNTLFENPAAQERFLALWEAIARRYQGLEAPNLVLELMNEVVLPTSEPWNRLAQRAVQRIRAVDPQRWIMIGGNWYNSAWKLKEIELLDDRHIVYTFHFYEPMPFTHQRARWVDFLRPLDEVTEYPGEVPGLDEFLVKNPQFKDNLQAYQGKRMDIDLLRYFLQPALDWLHKNRLPLYCGEFGVIDHAPLESRLRWHEDFTGLLRENGIGGAVWSYKEMNFALVRGDGSLVSEDLVRLVSGRNNTQPV